MIFTLKLHFSKKVKDIGMPKKREDGCSVVWIPNPQVKEGKVKDA